MNKDTASTAEHILVCLSASPSNEKLVHTAAKMAEAFGGTFTALYVQTPKFEKQNNIDKKRLQHHVLLAEKLGADIATVYGDDIPYQIAEFARLTGITKIVIGRSSIKKKYLFSKPTLTDKLIKMTPNMDIYIIPDTAGAHTYHEENAAFAQNIIPQPIDLLITALILTAVTLIGILFHELHFTESNIITIYILGALLTSLFTKGYTCSAISSILSVVLFNFFLTEPRFTLHAYGSGYPVTFAIMLLASIITGTLASKLKDHAKLSAQAAFRTKVLFDTNRLLQKAVDDDDMLNIIANQLIKLLDRTVIAYAENNGKLTKGYVFTANTDSEKNFVLSSLENAAAEWVFTHKIKAGATTDTLPEVKCLYLPIQSNNQVYGVIGIHINGKALDSFENSVLLSMLGECGLAIENSRNAKAKEAAAVLAKNEQLRANLLRTISHDLRTPLTSISGNAGTLLSNYDKLNTETRMQVFNDIYDDSQWLISLVENLLSVTRIEEGRMNFHMSPQLVEEVIEESMKHINRKSSQHQISVIYKDELMLAPMDAKLIIQVIINLVDNAIKYTPADSHIVITAEKQGTMISISIADDGPGIPDSLKDQVFEMFFTGVNKIADSRRSLGLGLPLCKSIINAHGGEIHLTDNNPQGSVFTFTLPSSEMSVSNSNYNQ